MKERKGRRSKVSDKYKNEKEMNEDEEVSSESEDADDESNSSVNEEKAEKKVSKINVRLSGKKSSKKIAADLFEEEEDNTSKETERRSRSKKTILDEDEINGEKNKKDPRRSGRKTEHKSLAEISESEDKEDEDEEIEKILKFTRKGLKKKKSFRLSESKKSKVDESEKNGESKSNEVVGNSAKNKSKKQKGGRMKNNDDENDEDEDTPEEYEVEKLVDIYFKRNGEREFLVRWKGYSSKYDTWEPEKHLNCQELISAFMQKCEKARSIPMREMRVDRRQTERYMVHSNFKGRKLSQRFKHKPRKNYCEE